MITLNIGPCRRRARAPEEIEKPDTPLEDLGRAYDFFGFLNGGLGGHRVVMNFLKDVSKNWATDRPVSILELRCGRGDLSATLVRWARSKGQEIRVLAVDECPSVIELARDYHGSIKEITFDVRYMNDARFLEAQQFDYVISSSALHTMDMDQAVKLLKIANLLAKRGIVFSDWLRDLRAWLWMQALARFWGDDVVVHDGLLSIRKGFTPLEVTRMAAQAGLDYARVSTHLGYRFSVAGERGLVLSPALAPYAPLAGT